MNFTWTEIWSIGIISYGIYVVLIRPSVGIGFEDYEPLCFLKEKGKVISGAICIIIGIILFYYSRKGFPIFD